MDWIPKPPNKTLMYPFFSKIPAKWMEHFPGEFPNFDPIQTILFGCFIMLTTQETPQGYRYLDSPSGSPDEPSDLLVICKGFFHTRDMAPGRTSRCFFQKKKTLVVWGVSGIIQPSYVAIIMMGAISKGKANVFQALVFRGHVKLWKGNYLVSNYGPVLGRKEHASVHILGGFNPFEKYDIDLSSQLGSFLKCLKPPPRYSRSVNVGRWLPNKSCKGFPSE